MVHSTQRIASLAPTQRAYLAGFIDGEGCIAIGKSHRIHFGQRVYYYDLVLKIGNTNKQVLDWIVQVTHLGKVRIETVPKNDRHSQDYTWDIRGYEASALLQCVREFLIIKKQEADLAIEYMENVGTHVRWRKRIPSQVAYSEKVYQQMKALKTQGNRQALAQQNPPEPPPEDFPLFP